MQCPACGAIALPGEESCQECSFPLQSVDVLGAGSGVGVDPQLMVAVSVIDAAPPIRLPPTATAREAIEQMGQKKCGAALVVDEDDSLVGIFSELDLLRRLDLEKYPTAEQPLWQIMTHNPTTLTERSTLAQAMHLMTTGGFRHCPIVRKGNRAHGLISFLDVLQHLYERERAGRTV